MITTYYQDYEGPSLKSCTLDDKDITSSIGECYGSNDWNGRLYRYRELFGEDCLNKKFKISYESDNRSFCQYGFVHNPDNYCWFRKFKVS